MLTDDDMHDVWVRCPRTGGGVQTGITHTLESWAAAYLPQQILSCTACGRVHYWTKEQAWLHKRRNRPELRLV
jgi:hypothetical protein